jgi:hypothetical protein
MSADFAASLWKQDFPRTTVLDGITVRCGGNLGWSVRKGGAQLKPAFDNFAARHADAVEMQGWLDASRRCEPSCEWTGSMQDKFECVVIANFASAPCLMNHDGQQQFSSARPGRPHLRGAVRPVHGADLHRHAERAGQRPRRGAQHAGRGHRLQHGLGLCRWRDVRAAQSGGPRPQGQTRACRAPCRPAGTGASPDPQRNRSHLQRPRDGGPGTYAPVDRRSAAAGHPGRRGDAARSARRDRRVPAGVPVDLSGGAALRLHCRPGHGQAPVGRGGYRHALCLRLRLGPL